nr:B3 domain-containing protein Os03g0212300-like [Aegilops tauschii subsp. strangulata]
MIAPPLAVQDPNEGNIGNQPLEFIVKLRGPPCSRLRLPTPFSRVMEVEQPPGLRLHMRGCSNGSMQADMEFPAPHVMLLRRGWKTFARAHSLAGGHVFHFKLMDATPLSVKVFGCSGARLWCCAESSTDEESSSSSDSDEEGSDGDDDGTDGEDNGSDTG